jgi:hypothetical protein
MRTPIAILLLAAPLLIAVLALAPDLAGGPATVAAADELKAGQVATLKGELLDMACYLGSGKTGPGHRKCAAMCAKAGQPMGLLTTDGKVLLIVASHEDDKPYQKAKDLCGAVVEVKGKVMESKGIWAIELHDVKEAS